MSTINSSLQQQQKRIKFYYGPVFNSLFKKVLLHLFCVCLHPICQHKASTIYQIQLESHLEVGFSLKLICLNNKKLIIPIAFNRLGFVPINFPVYYLSSKDHASLIWKKLNNKKVCLFFTLHPYT